MNILVPIPGVETGPQWAIDLYNALFTVIDQHDHTTGKGVPINAASIVLTTDFSMSSQNLINARSLRLAPQSTAIPAISPDLIELYAAPNGGSGIYDLWFNDGAGNQIPLTKNGAIVGTAGSISGLPSGTASASYASPTFTFQSATSTAANVDGRNFIFRNATAGSNSLTLMPPLAMSSNITMTLPTLPAAQNIVTLDNTGQFSAAWNVDNSTITVSSNLLNVPDGGITRPKLIAVGQQTDQTTTNTVLTNASFVNILSITITTTGRPVMLMIQPNSASSGISPSTNAAGFFQFVRGVTVLGGYKLQADSITSSFPVTFVFLDTPTAGTYNYLYQAASDSTNHVTIGPIRLYAYEL